VYELGHVGNMKRHPWCGGSARYAGGQDITVRFHSPTFPRVDIKNTLRRASPTHTALP